jgi:acetolactate synthase-1/2/3 large subunit
MKSEKPLYRVADYITEKLVDAGAKKIFLVTSAMIMHLTDSVLINLNAEYMCCHHEQAASMAVEISGVE